MEKIEINVANAKTKDDIQNILMKAMTLPEYYGKNLDALYDSVSTMYIGKRVEFSLKGLDKLPEDISDYGQKVKTILKRASKESIKVSDSTFIQVKE